MAAVYRIMSSSAATGMPSGYALRLLIDPHANQVPRHRPRMDGQSRPRPVAQTTLHGAGVRSGPRSSDGGNHPAGTIVVVGDVHNRARVGGLLHACGYVVHAAQDQREALEIVRQRTPDVVISDAGSAGAELCARLRDDPLARFVPVVLIGDRNEEARLLGIEAVATDVLCTPVCSGELIQKVRSLIRLKRYTDDLDSADTILATLARTIEARDPYTAGHCDRMTQYAGIFGTHLGLASDEVVALRRGGVLHDLGKVALPDAILLKAGPLTSAEPDVMKRHTQIGEHLCQDLKTLRLVRPIIRQHHERLDGSGYPDGISGEDVSLLAQMVGIVDAYDALTTVRPYRAAQGPEAACHVLAHEAEIGWRRRDLVSEFIRLCQIGALHYPLGPPPIG